MLLSYTDALIEAGVDEVGRGPIAGPVVAAAVILPRDFSEPRLRDSKKMSEKLREELEVIIKDKALAWAIFEVGEQEIDRINILQATYVAMNGAVGSLSVRPEFLLVDGNRFKGEHGIDYECFVGGDDRYLPIAAASVLAKCYRDRLMDKLGEEYPEYEWGKNKGYPTKAHKEAVERYGVTCYHRRSFRGVSEWCNTLFEL